MVSVQVATPIGRILEGYWKEIGRKLEGNWKGITKGFSSKSSAPWSPRWLFARLQVVEDLMGVGHSEVFIVIVVDLDHRGVDTRSEALNLDQKENISCNMGQ